MKKDLLKELQEREYDLMYQIDGIASYAGMAFCEHQLKELKKVREQIATLKGQNKKRTFSDLDNLTERVIL